MLFQIDSFAGLKNVGDDKRVMKVTQISPDAISLSGDLKSSVNFRIGLDGLPTTRNGQTSKLTGTDIPILWVNKAQTLCLFVDGTNLKYLNADYTASSSLYTVTAKKRMTFIEHNNVVYMGNGFQMLKYTGGVVSVWGDSDDISTEFELPQRVYRTPPLSNILLSYRVRTYVADGRFALYSVDEYPEKFRRAQVLTVDEDITAMSADNNCIYLHTLNTTTPFQGQDPTDHTRLEAYSIGAVKHGSIKPYQWPYILSKRGWAMCHDGIVEYLDHDNYRLNLADTAEAYLGYDEVNKEIIGVVVV